MELLEIEKELAGPHAEAAMKRYDEKLVALSERLSGALKAGVAPDEYARCTALDEVITIARKLLRLQLRK